MKSRFLYLKQAVDCKNKLSSTMMTYLVSLLAVEIAVAVLLLPVE